MASANNGPNISNIQDTIMKAWQDPDTATRYKNAETATRPFARILVEKAGLKHVSEDVNVFDLATGTGAAIQELYDAVPKEKWGHLKVLGGDVSPIMLDYLKKRGETAGWTGMETKVIDGNQPIDLPKGTYTHIFVTFGIFVMPGALPQLYELLKPGGFIGITTWATLAFSDLLDRSIEQMAEPKPYKPSADEIENRMFSGMKWGEEKWLKEKLESVGFENPQTTRELHSEPVGNPKLVLETMQFPMKMVQMWWEESKREQYLEECNKIMLEELTKVAGSPDGQCVLDFDGIAAWAYKKA